MELNGTKDITEPILKILWQNKIEFYKEELESGFHFHFNTMIPKHIRKMLSILKIKGDLDTEANDFRRPFRDLNGKTWISR